MKKKVIFWLVCFLMLMSLQANAGPWGGNSVISSYSVVTALFGSGSCAGVLNYDGTCLTLGTDFPGVYGTPTDTFVMVWKNDGGVWKASTGGAKTTNNATTGNVMVMTGTNTAGNLSSEDVITSGSMGGKLIRVDGHAALSLATAHRNL